MVNQVVSRWSALACEVYGPVWSIKSCPGGQPLLVKCTGQCGQSSLVQVVNDTVCGQFDKGCPLVAILTSSFFASAVQIGTGPAQLDTPLAVMQTSFLLPCVQFGTGRAQLETPPCSNACLFLFTSVCPVWYRTCSVRNTPL